MPELLAIHTRSTSCKFWYPVCVSAQPGADAALSDKVWPASGCPVWRWSEEAFPFSPVLAVLPFLLIGVPEGAAEPDPAGLCEPHRRAQPVSEGRLGLGSESEGSEDCHPGQARGGFVFFHFLKILAKTPLNSSTTSILTGVLWEAVIMNLFLWGD